MPDSAAKLPVTVILPTRNAREEIDAHIDAMLAWLPRAGQLVVVDSSEDGTLDRVRDRLGHLPNAEFHARPRGLYEGWNFGVSRAREDYVYFSTVGDVLEPGGLDWLHGGLASLGADLIVSPPRMIAADPARLPPKWPIQLVAEQLTSDAPVLLPPETAYVFATTFLPSTLLGSSASNLYCRDLLVTRPFPEGWGHCADSAWMVSLAAHVRMAVTRKCVAAFHLHEKDPALLRTTPEQQQDLERRALEALDARGGGDEARRELLRAWRLADQELKTRLRTRIEGLVHAVKVRDAQIVEAKERTAAVRRQFEHERAEVGRLHEKVVAARQLAECYERQHRSLPAILGLYGRAKLGQVRTLWRKFGGRRDGSAPPH